MHLFFSSKDELFQSNNKNKFIKYLVSLRQIGEFQIFKGINQRKREKNLNEIKCDIKKYCYFNIPIETNECSKE